MCFSKKTNRLPNSYHAEQSVHRMPRLVFQCHAEAVPHPSIAYGPRRQSNVTPRCQRPSFLRGIDFSERLMYSEFPLISDSRVYNIERHVLFHFFKGFVSLLGELISRLIEKVYQFI